MWLNARSIRGGIVAALVCGLLMTSCGGFGSTNNTNPGSTPNTTPQSSFRVVGRIGTPFYAKISDGRSSWDVYGVVPLSIIIVNSFANIRVSLNKLVSDDSLLSLQVINAFTVKQDSSTTDNFGYAPGNFGPVGNFAPPANPDVRFFVKGPTTELFDALVEDTQQGQILEARAPALILFDTPIGRVDATFSAVEFLGGFAVDLTVNGGLVEAASAGTSLTMKTNP